MSAIVVTIKPRLWCRFGVWACKSFAFPRLVGHGYTPQEAYDEWERLTA